MVGDTKVHPGVQYKSYKRRRHKSMRWSAHATHDEKKAKQTQHETHKIKQQRHSPYLVSTATKRIVFAVVTTEQSTRLNGQTSDVRATWMQPYEYESMKVKGTTAHSGTSQGRTDEKCTKCSHKVQQHSN